MQHDNTDSSEQPEGLGSREVHGILAEVSALADAPLAQRLTGFESAHNRLHQLLLQGPGPVGIPGQGPGPQPGDSA